MRRELAFLIGDIRSHNDTLARTRIDTLTRSLSPSAPAWTELVQQLGMIRGWIRTNPEGAAANTKNLLTELSRE
ncbi:MAG: hypothetical protein IPK13_26800 [Deltaproteobacteria bacterium]|nr:hypothetical protein [Deltaproteobacteria bacterium]